MTIEPVLTLIQSQINEIFVISIPKFTLRVRCCELIRCIPKHNIYRLITDCEKSFHYTCTPDCSQYRDLLHISHSHFFWGQTCAHTTHNEVNKQKASKKQTKKSGRKQFTQIYTAIFDLRHHLNHWVRHFV